MQAKQYTTPFTYTGPPATAQTHTLPGCWPGTIKHAATNRTLAKTLETHSLVHKSAATNQQYKSGILSLPATLQLLPVSLDECRAQQLLRHLLVARDSTRQHHHPVACTSQRSSEPMPVPDWHKRHKTCNGAPAYDVATINTALLLHIEASTCPSTGDQGAPRYLVPRMFSSRPSPLLTQPQCTGGTRPTVTTACTAAADRQAHGGRKTETRPMRQCNRCSSPFTSRHHNSSAGHGHRGPHC